MKTTWLKTALAVAVGALSSQAMAAGFALNEQSISGMGTSFAGRSSSADDATTLFGNPAGMSRLKREEVSFGMAAIHAKTEIKNASAATPQIDALDGARLPLDGSNDGDMVPFTAVPMGYYVKPIDEKWAVGVGLYVPFGMITDYENGFQGRYHGDYSEVRVITVQPTVSYRFNEQLSIGFGPTINRIDGQLESAALNRASPGVGDGRVKVKGDDTALGFNAGLLYEFSPQTRAGITYHSKVKYTLEGDTKLSGAGFAGATGKYDASLDLDTPESVDVSLTHELNDQWTLYAGAMWTRWSRFEAIIIENDGIPGPLQGSLSPIIEDQEWHDTWSYAIGAAYKLNRQWTLRTGLAFDQSPTNNVDRSPRIPTGDRTAVSFGLGWNPTDDITVDLAYSYLWEEDTKVRREHPTKGVYSADYENSAHGFGAALSYRF